MRLSIASAVLASLFGAATGVWWRVGMKLDIQRLGQILLIGVLIGILGLASVFFAGLAVASARYNLRKPAPSHADTDTQEMIINWTPLGTFIAHVRHVLYTGHRYTWPAQQ